MNNSKKIRQFLFAPGEIVIHKQHGYRGVIVEIDEEFLESDEWYAEMAISRPAKDQPWYHVLVDGEDTITYVAERQIELDPSGDPVAHPMVASSFAAYHDGRYHLMLH